MSWPVAGCNMLCSGITLFSSGRLYGNSYVVDIKESNFLCYMMPYLLRKALHGRVLECCYGLRFDTASMQTLRGLKCLQAEHG